MEKNIKIFFVLFLLFVIFFSLGTELPRRQRWGFFSDEAGYFSITQSLIHDGDLKYTKEDLQRIRLYFPSGPVGLFLKRVSSATGEGDGELYYAKSFAYPLLAAPFLGAFGVRGLLLFNGLMIFFSILMAYYLLSQYHPQKNSFRFALVFVLASVTPIYIWWLTADLFNFFVLFAALFFFFYPFKRQWLFYFAAFFFSLSAFSKPWNLAAIAVVYLILLYRKEWKRFVVLSLLSAVVCLGMVAFLYMQTGELSYKLYMGGDRRSFNDCFPYETPDCTFERGARMTFDNYWDRFFTSPKIIFVNLFYFFFGRFTGMFIYFASAFFVLILFFFQRKVPEDWFVFTAIVAAVLVFTLLAPDNYFGGSGAVGNRYFFNIFPLFFFLGFKNRIFKFSLIPVALALIFLSAAFIDSNHHSTTPRYAALSFPINLFPPEKTQYLSLPTNENPRAFGQQVRVGDKTYQIYFINDNYHTMEHGSFWSKGDQPLELFLSSPQPVKEFQVTLFTLQEKNRISFNIESKTRDVILQAGKNYNIKFNRITGLRMNNSYIYHIKIKSSTYYCGYLEKPDDEDKRLLGVRTNIGVEF